MLKLVPIFFLFGIVLGITSGILLIKCYFIIIGNGISNLYKLNRPNIWNMIIKYKNGEQSITDKKLIRIFNWIYYTRNISLTCFVASFILYLLAFALPN